MTNTPPTGTTPTPAPDPNAVNTSTNAIDANVKALQAQGYVVQKNTDYMVALDERLDQSRNMLAILTGNVNLSAQGFSSLGDSISDTMDNLSKFADLSQSQMTKFGAAVTAAFGATKSTFGGMNFENLNTFGGQLESLIEPIKNNEGALGLLANKLGVVLPNSVIGSAPLMARFIRDMATSSDNALKLEDTYIRAAAATGRLGDVHKDAGVQLEHINRMVTDQRAAINQTIIATNLSRDTVEAYYNELQKIPVALKDGVTHENAARGATEQLTKTIQLARGTGRDYKDILDDMREAVRDYNASIPEAMKFTAQISEISQNYNIELKDVQGSLRGTADAFKMFGNEAEGASNILNEYVGSLKATGLSGTVATDIVTNMTKQIGNLSIAQKAFLSAQSGGPGGLMGAYSIDMKLRQGKLDEVFAMAKNQLTKMMGPLVSTEEAARSPAAAAQMTKQIMMLQQGPLGQFARTPAEAERLIDALKAGRSSDFKPLLDGQKAVDSATKLGNDYAKQSATGISQIVAMMEEARGTASGANLNTLQAGFTAGAGTELENENLPAVQARKAAIGGNMEEAARRVGQPTTGEGFRTIENWQKILGQLPNALRSAAEGISNLLKPEGMQTKPEETMELPSFIKPQTSELGAPVITSGRQVGAAATTNANRGATTAANVGGPGPIAPTHMHPINTSGPLGEITVKVEGYCIHCKEQIEGSSQRYQVSQGSKI